MNRAPAPPAPPPPSPAASTAPVVSSRQLIGRGRELQIEHNGSRYRLRITANDKLILTK